MNQVLRYTCPKCGYKQYETGEIWAVGSIWTRLFEVHNRRFTFVSCQNCTYTELFKTPHRKIGEVYNSLAK